ncbi:hypothetical protein WN944_003827 [Citrus x changshan-huyou]|uniref:RNase H type-1 domain-containing protein n=1 Tax=Citrus x changshan-huyou TaxID=2935761 RepID=A0AAP0M2K0_9ROSI
MLKLPMLKASLASKEERWSPPDKNWFKLNSDAAINETEGLARLGVVIRNSREEFTATSICRRPFSGVIEFVEASAVLEGIELVVDLRLTPLMIESDSVNVADKAAKMALGQSESYTWLQDAPPEPALLL